MHPGLAPVEDGLHLGDELLLGEVELSRKGAAHTLERGTRRDEPVLLLQVLQRGIGGIANRGQKVQLARAQVLLGRLDAVHRPAEHEVWVHALQLGQRDRIARVERHGVVAEHREIHVSDELLDLNGHRKEALHPSFRIRGEQELGGGRHERRLAAVEHQAGTLPLLRRGLVLLRTRRHHHARQPRTAERVLHPGDRLATGRHDHLGVEFVQHRLWAQLDGERVPAPVPPEQKAVPGHGRVPRGTLPYQVRHVDAGRDERPDLHRLRLAVDDHLLGGHRARSGTPLHQLRAEGDAANRGHLLARLAVEPIAHFAHHGIELLATTLAAQRTKEGTNHDAERDLLHGDAGRRCGRDHQLGAGALLGRGVLASAFGGGSGLSGGVGLDCGHRFS